MWGRARPGYHVPDHIAKPQGFQHLPFRRLEAVGEEAIEHNLKFGLTELVLPCHRREIPDELKI